ncbi:MAG: serine hydrolase, partial [Gemmatimonadota bacterium]
VTYEWEGNRYQLDDFATHTDTTGLLIVKDGRILHEAYFLGATEDSLLTSWSMAKSVTSTLVGIAIADGLIEGVDDLVTEYLPELEGTGYEGVSIKDVLQMSTGVAFTEDYEDGASDFARLWHTAVDHKERANHVAASFTRSKEAGTEFSYSSNDTQILGWLLTRVTGKPLSLYLSEKIWTPLGMEKDAYWVLDRKGEDGMEMAWCCLNSTLRDYARFGMLMANSGRWEQRQVVPAEWIREATIPDRPQVEYGTLYPDFPPGYQYQWWAVPGPDRAFLALGVYGQFLLVNPAVGLVIVKTSAWPTSWDDPKGNETLALFEALTEALR